MVPTTRLAVLASVAAVIAAACAFVPSLRLPLGLFDGALVLLVLADAYTIRGRYFSVERSCPRVLSAGRSAHAVLTLRHTAGRAVAGIVGEDPFVGLEMPSLPARFVAHPGEVVRISYAIVPVVRGLSELAAVTVRYSSRLGLVDRQERFDLPQTLAVYPDVHAARALELLVRHGRADGRIGSLRGSGGDAELARLRPYQPGDDPRQIDWRATARREEPISREFQLESNQCVMLVLDVGRTMRSRIEGRSLVDRALDAALLLADVALRTGDRVGLLAFDDEPRLYLPPASGAAARRRITRETFALDASLRGTDYRAGLGFLARKLPARSLIVLVTNPCDERSSKELLLAVRMLTPKHLPLCASVRQCELEQMVLSSGADESALYVAGAAAEQLGERAHLLSHLRRAGAAVLDVRPQQFTPEIVRRYLDIKTRRAL